MQIQIQVMGQANDFKSTIAKIIADALDKHNIPCEVMDDPDWNAFQADRLAALAKRTDFLVKIKTIQIQKGGISDAIGN